MHLASLHNLQVLHLGDENFKTIKKLTVYEDLESTAVVDSLPHLNLTNKVCEVSNFF